MGDWLTVGGVALAWLVAVVVYAVVRMRALRQELDDTWDELARAISARHDAAADLGTETGRHGVLTDIAERVSDARAALALPGGASPVEQATAEREVDLAIRNILEQVEVDPHLVEDPAISALRSRVEQAHAGITRAERKYDDAARSLDRQVNGWPGRWVARWLRISPSGADDDSATR